MAYHYRVAGKPVTLRIDPTAVAVRYSDDLPNSRRARATEAVPGMQPFSKRFEIPGESLTLVPVHPPAAGGLGPVATINALDNRPEVAKARPVFQVGGNQVTPSDRVIVGLKDPGRLQAILRKFELTALNQRGDEVLARAAPHVDIFELCAQLDAEEGVAFSEPDFITIGHHVTSRPGVPPALAADPMSRGQYAMRLTHAFDAQAIQPGRPDIRIAIIDEGVDTTHPDLRNTVAAHFDAVDNDDYQEPNAWDGHGTACAGLAAASGGNAIGIRGAGAGCSLVSVRIAYSRAKGAPWITTNNTIATGIDWAWRLGRADVLSNSWGGSAPSNAIINAFEAARVRGRGGRGCVVVIAAGNIPGPVEFPATIPSVLAVAASNEFDEIKTPASSDREMWWGTSSGPEVSVAAPGVHNLTTDISGSNGYAVGDYVPNFNGTSSATPIVAGACGLLLSANPALHEADVRQAIISTADKIGAEPYRNGRNDFAGHGRLNVLRALNIIRGR